MFAIAAPQETMKSTRQAVNFHQGTGLLAGEAFEFEPARRDLQLELFALAEDGIEDGTTDALDLGDFLAVEGNCLGHAPEDAPFGGVNLKGARGQLGTRLEEPLAGSVGGPAVTAMVPVAVAGGAGGVVAARRRERVVGLRQDWAEGAAVIGWIAIHSVCWCLLYLLLGGS